MPAAGEQGAEVAEDSRGTGSDGWEGCDVGRRLLVALTVCCVDAEYAGMDGCVGDEMGSCVLIELAGVKEYKAGVEDVPLSTVRVRLCRCASDWP